MTLRALPDRVDTNGNGLGGVAARLRLQHMLMANVLLSTTSRWRIRIAAWS
jgi:hypothetical protein